LDRHISILDHAARCAFQEADVSALRSDAEGSAHGVAVPRRGPTQQHAPVAILSAAKRRALLACLDSGGLRKKAGAWHGPEKAKPISGVTVADLARDGMLTLITEHQTCSAQLTERGIWFAQTLFALGAVQGYLD
jgi:hypothetical protein